MKHTIFRALCRFNCNLTVSKDFQNYCKNICNAGFRVSTIDLIGSITEPIIKYFFIAGYEGV